MSEDSNAFSVKIQFCKPFPRNYILQKQYYYYYCYFEIHLSHNDTISPDISSNNRVITFFFLFFFQLLELFVNRRKHINLSNKTDQSEEKRK